jgi:hypothetical protein
MNDTEPTTATEAKAVVRIFEGKLHRAQRGHGKTFIDGPPSPPPEPVHRPARVAVMLALAHKIQDAIDRGVVREDQTPTESNPARNPEEGMMSKLLKCDFCGAETSTKQHAGWMVLAESFLPGPETMIMHCCPECCDRGFKRQLESIDELKSTFGNHRKQAWLKAVEQLRKEWNDMGTQA